MQNSAGAGSCGLPALPDTGLLLSLWSSVWSDLPCGSLTLSVWSEPVFSIHCHWHDMWICLGPWTCHSLHEIVGFIGVPPAAAQVTIEECFIASGHTLLWVFRRWTADTVCLCLFEQTTTTKQAGGWRGWRRARAANESLFLNSQQAKHTY